jgi:outer membrane protein OmpA-like peptidoglycan-associated protein/tetratricopeptide (TPR) repeat protein
MKHILYSLLLLFVANVSVAQTAKLKRANKFYNNLAFESAASLYSSLAEQNLLDDNDMHKLADAYYKMGDLKNAEPWFGKLYEKNIASNEETYAYAQCLKWVGNYDKANELMSKFAAASPSDLRSVDFNKNKAAFDKIRAAQPKFELKNLGINTAYADFGTAYRGNAVIFASSGKGGGYVKRIHTWNGEPFLNLYSGELKDGNISNVSTFRKKINTKYHEGPACFSADGNTMYFTRNNYFNKKFGTDKKGVNNLKIFRSVYKDGAWQDEEMLPFNSDEYSVGHPSLSADGSTLYFVSDMPGSIGGTDIWKVNVNTDGSFGTPENLGNTLNTEGNEMFPFIHQDGSLFFASNGHLGFGGLDIFMSRSNNGNFSAPLNLGAPLNSSADDFAFIVDKDQKNGFVSSNRSDSQGSDDIYAVKLTEPLMPEYRIEGIAYDRQTNQILANAEVELYDLAGNSLGVMATDENGAYSFTAEQAKKYVLTGKNANYFDSEETLSTASLDPSNPILKQDLYLDQKPELKFDGIVVDAKTGAIIPGAHVVVKDNRNGKNFADMTSDPNGKVAREVEGFKVGDKYNFFVTVEKEGYLTETLTLQDAVVKGKDIAFQANMDKLEVGGDLGKMININPIYFDKDKDFIRPDAAAELDKIVAVMKEYPNMVIELGSHTDCRASASYNMKLSDRRAKSSAAYIISKGIDKSRITGKGYGESQLTNGCECEGNKKSTCSEEEHQLNRRTVFKIVKM